jgi:hypothetical protein
MMADINIDVNVDVVHANATALLSLSLVHEIFEYIHIDFKKIIHREGNTFFDDDEGNILNDKVSDDDDSTFYVVKMKRLPLCLIMNSGLEDYFENVLLSPRFKNNLCDECAKRGQLDSLKWAKSKGCEWGRPGISGEGYVYTKLSGYEYTGTCSFAALNGHLHILQWARENGCEWNRETCRAAAEGGHLDILQWARANGCDWN